MTITDSPIGNRYLPSKADEECEGRHHRNRQTCSSQHHAYTRQNYIERPADPPGSWISAPVTSP